MQRGHISYLLFGKPKTETLKDHEGGGLPVGSPEAQAAVERVRRRLLGEKDRPASDRFVRKTGYGE